jgi:cytochrome c peroxidase
VLSIILGCVLLASPIPAAEALRMPLVSPVVESHQPLVPIPLHPALDAKRVALGARLFHEVRLSHDNTRSCTTCHPLERGGMDGRPRALAANGILHLRNTPTIFNVGLNAVFNWDGIANTLEAQAEGVLLHPNLMNTTWSEILAKLQADADYVSSFNTAYPGGLIPANVLDALASFERSLLTPNSRFDRYLRGEQHILTAPEQQGYQLFKSYGCIACHQGINIGGNMYQKFGVFQEPGGREPLLRLSTWAAITSPRCRETVRCFVCRACAMSR